MRRFAYESRKRFGRSARIDPQDANQAALTTLLSRLSRVDPEVLSDAYVFTAFKNALTDVHISAYGKPRPPSWIGRLGEPFTDIWRLFCLERYAETAIEELSRIERDLIRDTVQRLRARDDCPKNLVFVGIRQDADDLHDEANVSGAIVADNLDPVGEMDVSALQAMLSWVFAPQRQGSALDPEVSERLATALLQARQRLLDCCDLSDDERLMIRLRFLEGLSAPKAAEILGKQPQHVRRGIRRALDRVRACFDELALSPDDFV